MRRATARLLSVLLAAALLAGLAACGSKGKEVHRVN